MSARMNFLISILALLFLLPLSNQVTAGKDIHRFFGLKNTTAVNAHDLHLAFINEADKAKEIKDRDYIVAFKKILGFPNKTCVRGIKLRWGKVGNVVEHRIDEQKVTKLHGVKFPANGKNINLKVQPGDVENIYVRFKTDDGIDKITVDTDVSYWTDWDGENIGPVKYLGADVNPFDSLVGQNSYRTKFELCNIIDEPIFVYDFSISINNDTINFDDEDDTLDFQWMIPSGQIVFSDTMTLDSGETFSSPFYDVNNEGYEIAIARFVVIGSPADTGCSAVTSMPWTRKDNDMATGLCIPFSYVMDMNAFEPAVKFANVGYYYQENIPLELYIDPSGYYSTRQETLSYTEVKEVGFDQFTPPSIGRYLLTAISSLPGDEDPSDDTLEYYFIIQDYASFPYSSDFETSNGGIVGTGDWEWGAPTAGPSPHSGDNCWGTNLDGSYSDGLLLSELYLPLIYLPPDSNYQMSFYLWLNTDDDSLTRDGFNVKISRYFGQMWNNEFPVPFYDGYCTSENDSPLFDEMIYYGSKDWTLFTLNLSGYAGDTIIVELDFGADSISAGNLGAYIDDISIELFVPYFNYYPGDVNMYNGGWLPHPVVGADATYLINFFRGFATSHSCLMHNPFAPALWPSGQPGPYFWASADVNGDCQVIGADVTRLINYLRGSGTLSYCVEYEPAWHNPSELPASQPEDWPGCEIAPLFQGNFEIIPTGVAK